VHGLQELAAQAQQLAQLQQQHAALQATCQASLGELQHVQQRCTELQQSEAGLLSQLEAAQGELARFQLRLKELQVGGAAARGACVHVKLHALVQPAGAGCAFCRRFRLQLRLGAEKSC
jgi:chromosome segregation ATPase